jgi:hypothetical protein
VLPPSTWLPRPAVSGLAVAFLVTSLVIGDGRFTLVGGLFLLGSALVKHGVVDRLERATPGLALVGLGFAAAAAPALWWQAGLRADDRGFQLALALAGLLLAGVHVCAVLLLRSCQYRPLEWLWRWATWMRRPALRRDLTTETRSRQECH